MIIFLSPKFFAISGKTTTHNAPITVIGTKTTGYAIEVKIPYCDNAASFVKPNATNPKGRIVVVPKCKSDVESLAKVGGMAFSRISF